ncbi:spaetzle domain-containing protein [Lasioglossum baleicum]|uniref:spaetzle domain-containing protein n=1 Tax=Lasioglossum baleicum TaxID=434251 RepID=UPI003FCE4A76
MKVALLHSSFVPIKNEKMERLRKKLSIYVLTTFKYLQFMFESYVYSEESTVVPKLNEALFRDASCEHETFCESTVHYPTDLVAIALENNPHLTYHGYSEEIDTSIHDADGPEEEALCVTTEQIVFPKLGLTKSKEWKYIVNHKNLRQSVRIEVCLEEDKPCKVIEGFAEGYTTACKQKYIYRQLFAMGPNGTISRESFRFPASCCCHVEFQGDKFMKKLAFDN